ncbi:tannase/feruloyl esterase family alpha/beta hydrolase [Nonomuraea sp. JJY05]|uniref:tannase/feruloyl esterase family alpha/beta hydrolase n=1 Tax=Nonomuraea sp. JJY05 TaxID=3350255 RepID=UPI00373DF20B
MRGEQGGGDSESPAQLPLIPTKGTVDYRRRVERATGGDVDDFFRPFLAPGTEHCCLSGGQADDLTALIAWVEDGRPRPLSPSP